jgi:hypothetical protein
MVFWCDVGSALLRWQPCKVTNEGTEMKVAELEQDDGVIVVPQIQIPHPELGPLERRVSLSFEEAIFTPEVSYDDAEYWCTEPPGTYVCLDSPISPCALARAAVRSYLRVVNTGGWNQTPLVLKKPKVVANEVPSAQHCGEGRVRGDLIPAVLGHAPNTRKFFQGNICLYLQASLDTVQEGQELTGTISRLMLYYGAQVDIGAEYDG